MKWWGSPLGTASSLSSLIQEPELHSPNFTSSSLSELLGWIQDLLHIFSNTSYYCCPCYIKQHWIYSSSSSLPLHVSPSLSNPTTACETCWALFASLVVYGKYVDNIVMTDTGLGSAARSDWRPISLEFVCSVSIGDSTDSQPCLCPFTLSAEDRPTFTILLRYNVSKIMVRMVRVWCGLQQNKTQNLHKEALWRWFGLCGWAWTQECCKRTESLLCDPVTLLPWKKELLWCPHVHCCARKWNQRWSSSNSRTAGSFQADSRFHHLSYPCFYTRLQRKWPPLSTPAPSSSGPPAAGCTVPAPSSRTGLGGQGPVEAAPDTWLQCSLQTGRAQGGLCLDPGSDLPNLI